MKNNVSKIKKEKKKALYFREISKILHDLVEQEEAVSLVYPTRLDFSADNGICYVFFSVFNADNEQKSLSIFNKALEILKLYRSSIRKVLGERIRARYTPDIFFRYDEKRCKVNKINSLLSDVQKELDEYDKGA
jgi:ribosome-binding factor A